MARGETARITPRLWRKSSQWFALERSLAAIIVDDTDVAQVFKDTCVEYRYDEELERCACMPGRACITSLYITAFYNRPFRKWTVEWPIIRCGAGC
jgi:hypothetical protein